MILSPPERQRLREGSDPVARDQRRCSGRQDYPLSARGRSSMGVRRQLGCSIKRCGFGSKTLRDTSAWQVFQSSPWQGTSQQTRQAGKLRFGLRVRQEKTQGWLEHWSTPAKLGGRRTWHQPYASRRVIGQSRTAAPALAVHGQRTNRS